MRVVSEVKFLPRRSEPEPCNSPRRLAICFMRTKIGYIICPAFKILYFTPRSTQHQFIHYDQRVDDYQRYCPSTVSVLISISQEVETPLLIRVLTLEIRFTILPFTLAASSLEPPKEGSLGVLPHPTANARQHCSVISDGKPSNSARASCRISGAETEKKDILRARNRSSDRIATALTRRIETVYG